MTMLEDQQALQLVLENLSSTSHNAVSAVASRSNKTLNQNCSLTQPYNGLMYNLSGNRSSFLKENFLTADLKRSPTSMNNGVVNVTEHVFVPTSEHVAEIVGRQGCKIKALRNKTNTYIKTPGRGEDPLFIITGQPEDVSLAVNEIRQASEHFTNIRAQRNKGLAPPTSVPGQVTIKVKVPYKVVGLVVGPKGATIKQIQTKTSTYIVTPSRERDPVFEITGLPMNVENAKNEITNYIAMRTGVSLPASEDGLGISVSSCNNVLTRTPTGVWNPNKQDIDEISALDVLSSVNDIYGSTMSVPSSIYSDALNDFGGSGPGLGGIGSFITDEAFPPDNVLNMVNPILRESCLGNVNDENMDPEKGQDHRQSLMASKMNGLKSPLGVNTHSYSPFHWDNSSIFRMPNKSPQLARDGAFAGDTLSHVFAPPDTNKVSPMSTGSQHSSTESGNSLLGFNFNNDANAASGSKGFMDCWLNSPDQERSDSAGPNDKCQGCNVQPIGAAFIPCGHTQFCYFCAKQRISASCPSCAVSVESVLRIRK